MANAKNKKEDVFLSSQEADELSRLAGSEASSDTVIALANKILSIAVNHGASDVHLEPTRTASIIRFRVDGVLYDVLNLESEMHEFLVARFKVLAELKTDERRMPQDGRFSGSMEGKMIDFRVSVMPTVFGEKVAIRLLPQEIRYNLMTDLGMSNAAQGIIQAALSKPYGMVLVCGPTGTGKTTTLYALLRQLMAERKNEANFYTIEDPVEYSIDRVNQIQVNPQAGLTFHAALRGLLRQDTDIIMVGEVRDKETAESATQASLTGRLLLSTLHTRNAVGALVRLLDIGIEPYLVVSSVSLIIAQRLVRLNCENCSVKFVLDKATFDDLNQKYHLVEILDPASQEKLAASGALELVRGKGCDLCHYTGYRGRTGIYEVLALTEKMRGLVQRHGNLSDLHSQALAEGMTSMLQDGFMKVALGKTTLEEVLKVSLD